MDTSNLHDVVMTCDNEISAVTDLIYAEMVTALHATTEDSLDICAERLVVWHNRLQENIALKSQAIAQLDDS
jgi:hypothetical protein